VSEQPYQPRQRVSVVDGLKLMAGNGPFKRLVLAFMIGSLGLNVTTPLYLFFIADVLNAEDKAIYMLSFFYAASILAVPFWVAISKRIGKHRAYLVSFFMLAFAHPCYLLLGPGDFWWMLPMTLTTGFAAGGFSQTLPNSMKADVIDLDTLETGENRAALFFSAWSFAQKATASFGGAIALFGLSLVGFEAGVENGSDELFGLRFLFSTFPSLFFLVGAAIVWNYPITEARHAEIRAELEAKAN
jgi:Na+/melibiose symporter-like transporter